VATSSRELAAVARHPHPAPTKHGACSAAYVATGVQHCSTEQSRQLKIAATGMPATRVRPQVLETSIVSPALQTHLPGPR